MIQNRSVPADTVLPHLVYEDVAAAIEWLGKAFGFVEHYRYGDPASGAQMHLRNAWIMINSPRQGRATPAKSGQESQSLTVFVEDVDAHFERAKSAGVRIVEYPHETEYGERQYGAEDFAGHRWLFSRHARDVNPVDWGASVATPIVLSPGVSPMLAVTDAAGAIRFYQAAFGAAVLWKVGNEAHMVAGLSIHEAPFFLATESPEYGTRGPSGAGFTTVRIELFVEDPAAAHRQAVAAGASIHSPVVEHNYSMSGPRPIPRMLQGAVVDPFGHMWLIGRILE